MLTRVLLSAADAKDRVAKDSFPLKQEGAEDPQAQGEGAGEPLSVAALFLTLFELVLIQRFTF